MNVLRRALPLVVVVAMLSTNLVVLVLRTSAAVTRGDFVETTGTELAPIYGVWKARHGYPVYEHPLADTFSASLYNFSFYSLYGSVARAFNWDATDLVLGARLLTLAFAVLDGVVLAAIIRLLLRRLGQQETLAYSLMAGWVTTLSSAGVSWFYLSVRPDLAALGFALLGLLIYLHSEDRPRPSHVVACSVMFFAAWTFKQSYIGILGGVCCSALLFRRWRSLFLLVGPYVLLVVSCLMLGSPSYRENVLGLPGVSRFTEYRQAASQLLTILVVCAPLGVGLALTPWKTLFGHLRHGSDEDHRGLTTLVITLGVTLAWSIVTMVREGGLRNSLVEYFVILSALTWTVVRRPEALGTNRRQLAWVLTGVAAAAFPLAQVAAGPGPLGDIRLASDASVAEGRRIAGVIASLPKPVFVEATLLAEPWHSTGNRHPAFVLDGYLYHLARARGFLDASGGVEALIRSRHFPALLLAEGLISDQAVIAAGYERSPLVQRGANWNFQLFLRSSAPASGESTGWSGADLR